MNKIRGLRADLIICDDVMPPDEIASDFAAAAVDKLIVFCKYVLGREVQPYQEDLIRMLAEGRVQPAAPIRRKYDGRHAQRAFELYKAEQAKGQAQTKMRPRERREKASKDSSS